MKKITINPTITKRRIMSSLAVAVVAIHQFGRQTTVMAQEGISNPALNDSVWGNDPEAAYDGSTFASIFVYFWNVAMVIGGLIVLLFFIQGSIEWITAGGDSGKIQKARDRLIQSFIGLAILVFSFVIINFVGALLFGENFSLLRFELPTPTGT